ncbi:MAG: UDP-N-acetylglucosamine 1-carboxyvinyltransferase [Candidatus Spechtbacterales bacterium]
MPNKFIINGGNPLFGTINVLGSKNAALPILAATLLTHERCRISNLPLVLDVFEMLNILEQMGSNIQWISPRSIDIENKEINISRLDSDALNKMRASILLLGPLLARFGKVERMRYPGGCSIGARPIDTHLEAFSDLGATIIPGKKFFSVKMPPAPKRRAIVTLKEFSVTATENILSFLSAVPIKSQIKIAACEPHVRDLAKFLRKMGARISGDGTSTINIQGYRRLGGAAHRISPDYVEAGTFLIAPLVCGGRVRIRNVNPSDLDFVIKKLVSSGADIKLSPQDNSIEVKAEFPGAGIGGKRMVMENVQSLPHPGIPTDLQSVFSVLATQTEGATLIHEPLYEKRLSCIKELNKMGAKSKICDPHRAIVWGPVVLKGSKVSSYDLRGGAALVIAGLGASGTTIIGNIEHVERGYEDLGGRLRTLGADIKKI